MGGWFSVSPLWDQYDKVEANAKATEPAVPAREASFDYPHDIHLTKLKLWGSPNWSKILPVLISHSS